MTIGTVSWTRGLGLSGASEGGYDINATDIDPAFDNYVQDSLLFPYGGIRNDDGSYSYVNTRSLMIVDDDHSGGRKMIFSCRVFFSFYFYFILEESQLPCFDRIR